MALSTKDKLKLDIAMGSKAAADRLVAKMNANQALSAQEKRELAIALADQNAADEIAAELTASNTSDDAAVAAAQGDVDDAQADVDAAQDDVDAAQLALDADPGNPTLEQDLEDAQAALVAAQEVLADAEVALEAAKAAGLSNDVSDRSKRVLDIIMASKASGSALKSEMDK